MACSALGITSHHGEAMWDPPAPDTDDFPPSPRSLDTRIAAITSAQRVGWRVCVDTPVATVLRTAWLRRIDGITAEVIANRVATYLAFKQARTVVKCHRAGPVSDREAGPG
jgi:hypothetical protein